MERVLKIDPEFQNKIPPLTEDEFKQLEENIMDAGEVYEPITVWNDTIIDGHNRYKIVLMHPGIRWRVRQANFADKWEAISWMCANQLGRRNIQDPLVKEELIGLMYEARKKSNGGQKGNENAKKRDDQNEQVVSKPKSTAQTIADELNTSEMTVRRAGAFYRGMKAIEATDPEFANDIRSHKKNVSRENIRKIGTARPEVQENVIDEIKNAGPKKITKSETKKINSIVETLSDDSCMEYTIDHLTEQIRVNADAFIRSLSNLIMDHPDVTNGHQYEIVKAIDENITKRIMQIKEILNNGTQL